MLEKLVFILSEKYKSELEGTDGFKLLKKEVEERQVEMVTLALQEWTPEKTENAAEGEKTAKANTEGIEKNQTQKVSQRSPRTTLYLSDDATILAALQKKGCYTIAMYHEGVTGILSGTQYAVEGIDGSEWEYFYKIWQRFAGIPWEITQTPRCTLREMCVDDVDDLYELYSDERVTRYVEPLFAKKEEEVRYIRDYIENVYKYYGFGTWLIHRKEDGKLIGRAGFNFRPGFEEAELGFVIGTSFWRQGYAYEVCRVLMDIGRDVYDLQDIQAFVKKENLASVGLLEKLGFSYMEETMIEGQMYCRYLSKLA